MSDVTFDCNFARLNLDTRHGSAGFRCAVKRSDGADAVDRVLCAAQAYNRSESVNGRHAALKQTYPRNG